MVRLISPHVYHDELTFIRTFDAEMVSRRVKVICAAVLGVAILVCAITVPIVLSNNESSDGKNWPEDIIDREYFAKHDCMPDRSAEQEVCELRGCVFDQNSDPACYFNQTVYRLKEIEEENDRIIKTVVSDKSPIISSSIFETVKISQSYVNENIARVKFSPADQNRWEVPFKHPEAVSYNSKTNVYFSDLAAHYVIAKFHDDAVFDTHLSPLVFEDKYMQISTPLLKDYDYFGLGETDKAKYRLETHSGSRKRQTIWPVGKEVKRDKNSYGHHPFIMGVHAEGYTYAIALINSNLMEVEINDDLLIYRATGGVLDFYILVGETPGEVIACYHNLVGRTFMPPYWAYGYQLSKWGYSNLQEVKAGCPSEN